MIFWLIFFFFPKQMWDGFQGQDKDGIKSIRLGNRRTVHCTHRQIKRLFSLTVFMNDDRCNFFFNLNAVLPDFFSTKRPRGVMAKYYLLDSYSVGVESGWGSQMVGVFDSPDGCSVWCSVTLGRLIDMLPPSPPSLRLLFLHLLLQHSHCYEDGYRPPGLCRSWEEGMGLST